MADAPLELRFSQLRPLAVQAGRMTLEHFQTKGLEVEKKSDRSPVTVADKQAEQWLRTRILELFPDDAVLGEEWGETLGTSGFRWILDPIDGTKSFISGVPLYGTMVGLESDGKAVMGAVYLPGLDEGIYAAAGKGCWHFQQDQPPVPAQVSDRTELNDAIFVTSEVKTFGRQNREAAFLALQEACYITRTWGDCYGYLLVATGRADIMVDPQMSIWDAAAVMPILQEAGGTFTNWQGEATISAGEGIGTNRLLLEQVLAITSQYPAPK